LIIGLPGETLKSFKRTVNFLKDHDLISNTIAFQFQLLPGTEFFHKKNLYGIKSLELPPYYVYETNTLSKEEMTECFRIFNLYKYGKTKKKMFYLGGVPSTQYDGYISPQKVRFENSKYEVPITKIFINTSRFHKNNTVSLGEDLKGKIANNVVIWIESINFKLDFADIKLFLKTLSSCNPYTVWNVFLYVNPPVSLSELIALKEILVKKEHFLKENVRIFVVISFENMSLLEDYRKSIPLNFWCIKLKRKENWKEKLIELVLKEVNLFYKSVFTGIMVYR
jgi:hypothetical protein